ncbi:hypothetical protein, partial [Pseudomonas aeruginosa]|uniref:hypothetical protein n=1 Tax=Pseudomonas aeruginosa TaxID=287 RepID=UPI001A7E6157
PSIGGLKELRQVDVQAMASENRRITALQLFALPLTAIGALHNHSSALRTHTTQRQTAPESSGVFH